MAVDSFREITIAATTGIAGGAAGVALPATLTRIQVPGRTRLEMAAPAGRIPIRELTAPDTVVAAAPAPNNGNICASNKW